ncbi:MAG TPA: flagellar biosynthesis protein FlhB [Phycisphaerae bacterium]|jgi:flagellar biosynthetic protein FlhB
MPDEFGEKTEPATPRRRSEARQRGQVPRSHDLTTAVLLLGLLLLLKYFGPGVWRTLLAIVQRGLATSEIDRGQLAPFSFTMALDAARAIAPLLGIAFVLALAVTAAQVGWLLTLHPLTPTLAKINPLNGLRRLFSARALVTLALNTIKLALVAGVAWWTIHGQIQAILAAIETDHAVLLARAAGLTYTLGVRLALLLVVLAIVDYVYQRYRHERDLRMTKEEVKEELRRMEGDPVLKRRRRQIQMQLALQRVRSAVPKADVVVTNPTHLAIAIQYDADTMNAPLVVAKGADYLALRIRELAAAHGIPMVERPTLARLMYDAVEVGKEIPSRFYQAIAEILAYVYELTGQRMGPAPVAV